MPPCRRAWRLLRPPRLQHPYPLLPSSRRSFRAPVLPPRRHPLPPLLRPRAVAVCLGTVVLPLRRPSLRPRRPLQPAAPASQPTPAPKPQPATSPAPAPAAVPAPKLQPNTAAQVAAAGAVETPAVEDAGELQRKWAEVVERVKARQASYAGLFAQRPRHGRRWLQAHGLVPRGFDFLPLRCSVAPIRNRWSCRRSAQSSVVVPSTMSWMGVARRLLNMRSILHLHGLRHLRTRNPCPRRPLYPRAPARRSSKRCR